MATPLGLPTPMASEAPRIDLWAKAFGTAAREALYVSPLHASREWTFIAIPAGVTTPIVTLDVTFSGSGIAVIFGGLEFVPQENNPIPTMTAALRTRGLNIVEGMVTHPSVVGNQSHLHLMCVVAFDPAIHGDGLSIDLMTNLNDPTYNAPYATALYPHIAVVASRSGHISV